MIQIIDYGAGNLQSIKNALTKLGAEYQLIRTPAEINPNSKIIFAGVGAAGSAMANLKASGFADVLPKLQNTFLGICLGMQVLFESSEENQAECLGVIEGEVRLFPQGLVVPQIGWNKVEFTACPLFRGIDADSYFYFVNSYYAPLSGSTIARSEYAISFSAAVQKENFYGVQFHPEKSGEAGEKLLANFIELC